MDSGVKTSRLVLFLNQDGSRTFSASLAVFLTFIVTIKTQKHGERGEEDERQEMLRLRQNKVENLPCAAKPAGL